MLRTLGFVMLLVLGHAAHAQIRPGDRVRIEAGPEWAEGTVLDARRDTLVVAMGDGAQAFARADIERAELRVTRSRAHGALGGAAVGLGVAGVATLVTAAVAVPDSEGWGLLSVAIVGMIAAPTLTALGAGVGALAPGRRWREVATAEPPPMRARVAPSLRGGGPGLALRVRL